MSAPMAERVRCSADVPVRTTFTRFAQCQRWAVGVFDGKPLCKQHSPEAAAVRRAKGQAAFDARMAQFTAPFKEANALRLSLAASQAECARLREVLLESCGCPFKFIGDCVHSGTVRTHPAKAALATPSPEDALRAFGERCVLAGRKDAIDEMGAWDAGVTRPQQEPSAIVDRVMRGGRDA